MPRIRSTIVLLVASAGTLLFAPARTDVPPAFLLKWGTPGTGVYSRSGRLVREVVSGQSMNAGSNLVRWDGRDRNGGFATDGLYQVTVKALGRTERKTLAIVK